MRGEEGHVLPWAKIDFVCGTNKLTRIITVPGSHSGDIRAALFPQFSRSSFLATFTFINARCFHLAPLLELGLKIYHAFC